MRGDVTVRIQCLMPEKLIERAVSKGARFDDVLRPDGQTLIIRCDRCSARRLLTICRRYGLPAQVIGLRGGSALRRLARLRPTLAVGIILAVALSALFLNRVWKIDIVFSGENAALGDPTALSRSLNRLDVRPGMLRQLLDSVLIAQALQANDGDFSYVGAHLQGIRLLVEAVPETPAPPVYDVEAARDMVSAADGIVVRAVARSGVLCVAPGDTVTRGQLLIRGEALAGPEETTRPVAALGEVIVRTWFEGSARIPLVMERSVDTGRSSIAIKLVGPCFQWPIAEAEGYTNQRETAEYLPIGGVFLPLEIQRVTRREIRTTQEKIDPEAAKARLELLALADAALALYRNAPVDYETTRCWTDYYYTDDALFARAVLEIQTDAAVTRETLQGGRRIGKQGTGPY